MYQILSQKTSLENFLPLQFLQSLHFLILTSTETTMNVSTQEGWMFQWVLDKHPPLVMV